MINVEKLKQKRADAVRGMRDITSAAEARDDKRMTQAEADKWESLNAEVEALDAEIKRSVRMNELEMASADALAQTEVPDDSYTRDAMSFGEFLRAVRDHATPGRDADRRLYEGRAASGQNESTPSEGGFLVGEDTMAGIMSRMYDVSAIAGRCRRQPIGAGSNAIAWNELAEDSRVNGSRNGGVRAYWVAEADEITASKQKFDKRRLELEKLAAIAYATNEMLQDTTALESFMTESAAKELAFVLDDAILRGSGAGMPLGLLNADSLVSVDKEAGQSADTIVWQNVLKMRQRLWARSRQNAVWYINQDIEEELSTMALVVGTGGVPVYLPAGGASVDGYDRLHGRPVIPVEQCSTLGDKGDIILADMSQYMLIEKGGVQKNTSMHVRFLYDEMAFRFTLRVNGAPGPSWLKALTPYKGTSTLSPFVTLAERA